MFFKSKSKQENLKNRANANNIAIASTFIDNHQMSDIQAKYSVSKPGNKYEREADSVTDQVMKTNDNNAVQMQTVEEETAQAKMQMKPVQEEEETVQTKIQMQPAEEEEELVQPKIQMRAAEEEEESIQMQPNEEDEESLQMKSIIQKSPDGNQYASNDISQKLNSTKGTGEKLPNKVEAEMGRKIGADFSATKIHTDSHAVQMNRKLGAQAFTHGRDIYFNQGKYDPGSSKGKHLLAHELTHTIQQGKSIVKTKKSKFKQSSNDYIQRFPLNTTNINKLREHLSNDNESEAITLMANLTVDEKDAVLNSREFKELAISSFGDDEMYRAMKALRHNLYKSLEWMFDEGTNWEAVANLIRLVPDKKDVVRTDNWMKKQFVSICDNKTMAEAVDLLGGTLLEKLLWMHAEGSSWELIKEKLENPKHIKEKTTLYGSSKVRDLFVSNRNDKEMAEAVDILGGTLLQKLTWMKAEGSNWGLIRNKIIATSDPNEKKALYARTDMRDFFVNNCNDKEMAEAVILLGSTLTEKLWWIAAEGTDENLVFKVVNSSPSSEYKDAFDNISLMDALKKELSKSEYDNVKNMLTKGAPQIAATEQEMGQSHVNATTDINTGLTATKGVWYAHNYRYRAKKYDNDPHTYAHYKPYYKFWKEDYTYGYANPKYWKRKKNGFMDWILKPLQTASGAIKSWLKGLTIAECTSALVAVKLDTFRKAIGDVRFDKLFSSAYNNIPINGLLRVTQSPFTSSLSSVIQHTTASHSAPGTVGNRNVKLGEWHYFYNHPAYLLKHPSGAFQGENAIYMGKVGGVQQWAGLGVTKRSEMDLLTEMAKAYNGKRTNRDYWWIVNKYVKRQGYDYNKNYKTIYNANIVSVPAIYQETGTHFPIGHNAVSAATILSAPDQIIGTTSRKGGFVPTAGKKINKSKVETYRNM